jgi:hypothetical protein
MSIHPDFEVVLSIIQRIEWLPTDWIAVLPGEHSLSFYYNVLYYLTMNYDFLRVLRGTKAPWDMSDLYRVSRFMYKNQGFNSIEELWNDYIFKVQYEATTRMTNVYLKKKKLNVICLLQEKFPRSIVFVISLFI